MTGDPASASTPRYLARFVSGWWSYTWAYFLAATFINALLVSMYADANLKDIAAVFFDPDYHTTGTARGRWLSWMFMLFGPLTNLYFSIISARSAFEADDDIAHEAARSGTALMTGQKPRAIAIFAASLISGIVLLPFTLWCYTAQVNWLWGQDGGFLKQPGLYMSLTLIVLAYAVLPSRFPGILRSLVRLQERVDDTLS